MPKSFKLLTVCAAALVCASTMMQPVAAQDIVASDEVFTMFTQNLQEGAERRDAVAISNQEVLDGLTETELAELKQTLVSGDIAEAIVNGEARERSGITVTTTVTDASTSAGQISLMAMNGIDTMEGCLSAERLGVELVKVCTGGSYRSMIGLPQEITNVRSIVKYNYAPGLNVSMSNPRGFVEGPAVAFYAEYRAAAFENFDWLGALGTVEGTHRVLGSPVNNLVLLNYIY